MVKWYIYGAGGLGVETMDILMQMNAASAARTFSLFSWSIHQKLTRWQDFR